MTNETTKKIKLWIHLHKDDIKGFFKLFVPILLFIFFIRKIPTITRNYTLSKFDSEIVGIIDSIEKRKGIHESEIGGKVIIKKYKIDYHIQIDDKEIHQSEIIDRNSVTLKQRFKLNEIEKGDSVLIRYDSKNLENSKIEIN